MTYSGSIDKVRETSSANRWASAATESVIAIRIGYPLRIVPER